MIKSFLVVLLSFVCVSLYCFAGDDEEDKGPPEVMTAPYVQVLAKAIECEQFIQDRGQWLNYIEKKTSSFAAMRKNPRLRLLECTQFIFIYDEDPADWGVYQQGPKSKGLHRYDA